jgi:hypothetical protein
MATFELLDPKHLNYQEFAEMQRKAYADLMLEMKTSDEFMTPEYYRWKHQPPNGNAKIAVIREDGCMVAANSMIPFKIRLGSESVQAWQSSDTATLPNTRHRDYFLKCQTILIKTLNPNEIFYGFPNKNSTHGLLKLGWQDKGIITTWVNPRIFLRKRMSPNITEITMFGDDQDSLAERLLDSRKAMIFRSAKYLNWRYNHHPIYEYTSFVYRQGDELVGYVVMSTRDIRNHQVAIIMDLWGSEPRVERALINHVANWTYKQQIKIIILLDTDLPIITGFSRGFFPVPSQFIPKRQVLMGFTTPGQKAERIWKSQWRVQMGDWEVF